MDIFCKNLRMNKVKETQEQFKKLNDKEKELLLSYSWKLLQRHQTNSNSYWNAFKLFKLFRNSEMKNLGVYKKYNNSQVDKEYMKAYQLNKQKNINDEDDEPISKLKKSKIIDEDDEPISKLKKSKTEEKKESKTSKYDKKYQRYDTPYEGESLYLYYTSLYEEIPNSKSAIRWLTEYGVYDGLKRKELEHKYSKI